MKIDRNAIVRRQIAALDGLGRGELQRKFAELFGFERKTCNDRSLRFRIAYRLQELQFGGLSQETEELLDTLADADPLANLEPVKPRIFTHARGTRYVREWRGREYVVTVLGPREFEYGNEIFTSLTAVATRITGTHQSGKSFFGVQK